MVIKWEKIKDLVELRIQREMEMLDKAIRGENTELFLNNFIEGALLMGKAMGQSEEEVLKFLLDEYGVEDVR